MSETAPKLYASCIVENRLSNRLFDTILQHRNMLPDWWSHAHVEDPSVKTLADYNRLLTSKSFWQQFERFDRVLVFQHDSRILRRGIEAFLEWDFIGAPLGHVESLKDCMNGGFSLRNPKAMIQLIEHERYGGMDAHGNEDIYFVRGLRKLGAKLPDVETAKTFSVETIFAPNPFGVHAPEKWLTAEQLRELGL